jgi:TRAP-type C4-dicarboxylate transport system permease small subunit
MTALLALLAPLEWVNSRVLALGRLLAITALAIMVCFILSQVFFRYVMNDALNWSEEGARFLMLWMTGLIAPMAYRQGGFVAIDMAERALGQTLSALLTLALLFCAMIVLYYGVQLGWDNVNSLSGRGTSPSLRLPLDWFGADKPMKFKNSWAYASLFVGMCLLMAVNIELILRQLIALCGGAARLKPIESAGPID